MAAWVRWLIDSPFSLVHVSPLALFYSWFLCRSLAQTELLWLGLLLSSVCMKVLVSFHSIFMPFSNKLYFITCHVHEVYLFPFSPQPKHVQPHNESCDLILFFIASAAFLQLVSGINIKGSFATCQWVMNPLIHEETCKLTQWSKLLTRLGALFDSKHNFGIA